MKSNKNREVMSSLLPLYLKNHSVGKVHSKFKRGVNLRFEDYLIYISSVNTPLAAFGLNIDNDKLQVILETAKIDDVVVYKDDKLVFYSVGKIITISLKYVEEVDLKLGKTKYSTSEISETKLYNYLREIKFQELIGLDLDEVTLMYLKMLVNFDRFNWDKSSTIIRFFSGRGKGLTPSGDDIIIGFTMALKIFGEFPEWMDALKIELLENRTTFISKMYLRALLDGHVSEDFLEFSKLMECENVNIIEKIIKKVQSFGHTSGNDTLFGFYLGLKFLIN